MDKNFRVRVIVALGMFIVALVALYTFNSIPFKIIFGLFALVSIIELMYNKVKNTLRKIDMKLERAKYGYIERLPREIEYFNGGLYDAVYEASCKWPHNTALEYFDTQITYKELIKKINKVAAALKAIGAEKGENITICMPNTPEGIYMIYAVNEIGAVANMVHPLSSEKEIEDYLNQAHSMILSVIFMIFALLPYDWAKIVALIVFIIAAITDKIDGAWARKNKLVTDMGAFLDPLADKMLINLAFLVLTYLNIVPLWVFAIILIRDFAVDGMRMMAAHDGITIAASFYGKLKTTVQMTALIILLSNFILDWSFLTIIGNITLYLALILTIFSGVDYLIKGYQKVIKKSKK